ncbi:MAG: SBBP repeat-containing protein [Candidatus Helarchaeota archaeon]
MVFSRKNKEEVRNRTRKTRTLIVAVISIILIFSAALMLPTGYMRRNSAVAINESAKSYPNYVYQWNSTFDIGNEDAGNGVVMDSSGNIYVTGYTKSIRYNGFHAMLDSVGTLEWNYTWGTGYDDVGYDMAIYDDSNIYVVGEYDYDILFGNDYIITYKLNQTGAREWTDYYNGGYSGHGYGMTIKGGITPIIYVTGKLGITSPKVVLVSYLLNGVLLNTTEYDEPTKDIGRAVGVDSQNNIYVAGTTEDGTGALNVLLLKYDSNFHLIWNVSWGDSGDENVYDMCIDDEDNIYICGSIELMGGTQAFLLKYNSAGVLQWSRIWASYETECARSITMDSASNLIIGGYVINGGKKDVMITGFDLDGLQWWYEIWGGDGNDVCNGVFAGEDGSIVFCGTTNSTGMGEYDGDVLIIKYANITFTSPTTTTTSSAIPGFDMLLVTITMFLIFITAIEIRKNKKRCPQFT